MRVLKLAIIVVVYLLASRQLASAQSCYSFYSSPNQRITQAPAWDVLRAQHLLAIQDKPGKCGGACVVNLVQGALSAAGEKPMATPQLEFDSIAETIGLGMPLPELINRSKDLLESTAPRLIFRESGKATLMMSPNKTQGLERVQVLTPEDIEPSQGTLTVIAALLYDSNDTLLGVHAQIVESVNGHEIKLIEPRAPYDDFTLDYAGETEAGRSKAPTYKYRTPLIVDHMQAVRIIPIGVVKLRVERRK